MLSQCHQNLLRIDLAVEKKNQPNSSKKLRMIMPEIFNSEGSMEYELAFYLYLLYGALCVHNHADSVVFTVKRSVNHTCTHSTCVILKSET